jgi:NDP-sugar pyrophosphorylase family protein
MIFSVKGFSQETASKEIRFGTGRYILGTGLMYLQEYLLQQHIGKSEELDDDMVFEPLWEQGVHGILLKKPIHDVGILENWLRCVKEFARREIQNI